ncbi:MAG: hypothetical protein HYV76_00515 [Candidatus Vogelbacteria bacterium]|nr:hypothetical protein [Candidatus Vogelbacteria bacterium]
MEYALEVKPRVAFPVHDGGLVKAIGITKRLPEIFLPQAGIEFVYLELGQEREF